MLRNCFSIFMPSYNTAPSQQAAQSGISTIDSSPVVSTQESQESNFSADQVSLPLSPSIFLQTPPPACVTVMDYLSQEPRFSMFLEMIQIAGFTRFFNQSDLEGTLFVTSNTGFEQVFESFGISREEFYADSQLPRIAAYSILDKPITTQDMQNLQFVDTVLPEGVIYIQQEYTDQLFLIPIATEFEGEIIQGDKKQCNIIVHEVSTLMLPLFNSDATLAKHPATEPPPPQQNFEIQSPEVENFGVNDVYQYYQYVISKPYQYQNRQYHNYYKTPKKIDYIASYENAENQVQEFGG
eukprot:TRINITY_DN3757_c0_g2_i1.p1 TRINITY_DN3757_c0_g2~~TRINITY_DN3757_c0_g2_i1.p1  ORF type:complete len:296 (-),score=24.56 TRINITY_DN3757_c0_g2_i1:217-1104(-)